MTNAHLRIMRLKRITTVKRKKEIKSKCLTNNNSGICELCSSTADNLAEFNRREVCSNCFQQMIQRLISGRRNDSFVKEIFSYDHRALDAEDALMVA